MLRKSEKFLSDWLRQTKKKPLMIRGARQVGKSTLVRQFADSAKLSLFEVNLEQHPQLQKFFLSNQAETILKEIQLLCRKGPVNSQDTLLFLDEIQAIPQSIESLRYLQEANPHLPIICAGSLIEFAFAEQDFSMPVGRIDYLFMGPATFEELLLNEKRLDLLDYLSHYKIGQQFSETAHQQLSQLFRTYCHIGGMPEAMQAYLDANDFSLVSRIHKSINNTYADDFGKYARSSALIHLQKILQYLPLTLGEKIKYSKIDPNTKSGTLKQALNLLAKAQVIELAYHTAGNSIPIRAEADLEIFKPYALDVGLVQSLLGLEIGEERARSLLLPDRGGKISEQFIAQHLLRIQDPLTRPGLYYWLRESKQTNAEVDFIFQLSDRVLPIEVKSGSAGSLKSLHQFMHHKKNNLAIRFDSCPPSFQNINFKLTSEEANVSFKLITLPHYMVEAMPRLIHDFLAA